MIWGCGFIDCKVEWSEYILVCSVLKRVNWFIDIKMDIMVVVYWLLMEDLRRRSYVFMNWYVWSRVVKRNKNEKWKIKRKKW